MAVVINIIVPSCSMSGRKRWEAGGRIKTQMHTLNLGDVKVVNFAFVLYSLLSLWVVLLVVLVAMVMARKTFPNALYFTTPDHPLHGGNW